MTLAIVRNEQEARSHLRRNHSFIGEIDLAQAGIEQAGGLEYPYPGFGLYLSYQTTPPGTQLRVFFDRNITKSVLMRPGTAFYPGPVETQGRRASAYFERLFIQRTAESADVGTAHLVVLGAPEARFSEDPSGLGYMSDVVTVSPINDTLVVRYGPTVLNSLSSARLYIHNTGAELLENVQVEISPDGVAWEEILVNQFGSLAAGALRSRNLPANIELLRVRAAAEAGNTTSANFWLSGRY